LFDISVIFSNPVELDVSLSNACIFGKEKEKGTKTKYNED